jgi:dihydroneopterin aldolase
VQAIAARRPVSATIGDLPEMEPRTMVAAVERMAATGVDYVKIGFFAHRHAPACAAALAQPARQARLVAVLFGDAPYDLNLLDALAAAGFTGAMLDTAGKANGSLLRWRNALELGQFVDRARVAGLLSGLAGSLQEADIAPLLQLSADYLGFRGALCAGRDRSQRLEKRALERIRSLIPAHRAHSSLPAQAPQRPHASSAA